MEPTTGSEVRDEILEYLRGQLIGPVKGDAELLREQPYQRYLTGILYPRVPVGTTADEAEDDGEVDDEAPGQIADDADEDPMTLAGQNKPSSVGVSFVADRRCAVRVEIAAGRYVPGSKEGEWRRVPLDFTGNDAVVVDPPQTAKSFDDVFLDDAGIRVRVTWRPHQGTTIVTVVIVNNRDHDGHGIIDAKDCLFQVSVRCRPEAGRVLRYPSRRHLYSDDEAEELELAYRNAPVFAIGHGSAADWSDLGPDGPEYVQTSFLPVHVVPGVSFDVDDAPKRVRDLHRLSKIRELPSEIIPELHMFVDGYETWCDQLAAEAAESLIPAHEATVERVLQRIRAAAARMRRGIELLEDEAEVRHAFALANEAMLMQLIHGGEAFAGTAHSVREAPDVANVDYPSDTAYWRPFQLAFLLLTLDGVATDSADRDIVDLIWFPTGGGKTEAYLGLAAFTIMLRRIRNGDEGAGTTVITRYTLRLLTSQQFLRASTMIAACELLRRRDESLLGSRPISIGVWVGGGNSPNSYAEAAKLLAGLKNGEELETGFQIEVCPWCGTRVVPGRDDEDQLWGIHVTNVSFQVRCLNGTCPFAGELPVSSVDEALYEDPPTMLVGTVDKFARTVWDERTGVFFGARRDPGPSLIIQDEFHLISGPLGTIVGLYEAAFDVLMSQSGSRPKIVASTATIRRAGEQSLGVFGRQVALFPPAGLDADDSYFVRTDRTGTGRAYVGLMPQGHTPLTGLIHLSAALLQAPIDLGLAGSAKDLYWTYVAYHNSLRELGKTITLAHDDIPARLQVIAEADDTCRTLSHDNVVELTSNIPPREIPRVLEHLKVTTEQGGAVSMLASTNMLSVGVDVARLGLMAVVGQPKSTAEYIQASSRVGRGKDRPGLVVTLYSPSKPRDRSHYESFVPYHAALYKSVEPTSVTPFSHPARTRALHACLVILARHARGWRAVKDAARFHSTDPELKVLISAFLERVKLADPEEFERVRRHLDVLCKEWDDFVADAEAVGAELHYSGPGRERPVVLRRFQETGSGWRTLDSMRSVDAEVAVQVRRRQS